MMKELDVNKPYPTDEELERMPVMAEEGIDPPEMRSSELVDVLTREIADMKDEAREEQRHVEKRLKPFYDREIYALVELQKRVLRRLASTSTERRSATDARRKNVNEGATEC